MVLSLFSRSIQWGQNALYPDNADRAVGGGYCYRYYWLLCFLFTAFMLLFNSWALDGEMWAEMGTNFYPQSHRPDLYSRLFSLDSGYIPFTQRLLAIMASASGMSAAVTAYFYTWSAIFLVSLTVGVFCLPIFRSVVASDLFRFLIALVVLVFPCWETMTFINFIYVYVFLVAIVLVLAFDPKADDAPVWMYAFPILMFGKAYMLVFSPLLFLALFATKPRFKIIFAISLLFLVLHFVQIAISSADGAMKQGGEVLPMLERLLAGWLYSFSLFGGYSLGGEVFFENSVLGIQFAVGFLLVVVASSLFFMKCRGAMLVLLGLLLVFGASFLNAVALYAGWNLKLYETLAYLPIYRHTLPGFIGVLLVVVGVVEAVYQLLCRCSIARVYRTFTALGIFSLWFVATGWSEIAINNSAPLKWPYTKHSQWQLMAEEIDSSPAVLCVPLDPSPWLYRRNCEYIQLQNWGGIYKYDPRLTAEGIEVVLDPHLTKKNMHSLAFRVAGAGSVSSTVSLSAEVVTEAGKAHFFTGSNRVGPDGALILLNKVQGEKVIAPVSMVVRASVPVKTYTSNTGLLRFDVMGNALDEFDAEFEPSHFVMVPTDKLTPQRSLDLHLSPEYLQASERINGIGINFATYMKSNFGRAKIDFTDTNGNVFMVKFSLSDLRDNKYYFFDLPPAQYVSAKISVLSGSGGVSVWKSHSIKAIARSCLIYEVEEPAPIIYTDRYTRRYTKGCPLD